jgi:hypothetical protein
MVRRSPCLHRTWYSVCIILPRVRKQLQLKDRGEGKAFYSMDEVIIAYNEGKVDLHAWIKVKTNVRENDGLLLRN